MESHPPTVEPPTIITDPSSSLATLGYHRGEVRRTRLGLSNTSHEVPEQGVYIRTACKPFVLPFALKFRVSVKWKRNLLE